MSAHRQRLEWGAAILAGGRATRFGGRDKAALRVGNAAVLERQLEVLRSIAVNTIIIANDEAPYRDYGVPIVSDLIPGVGAIGGIYTAIRSSGAERTLVVACDMPFLSAPFLSHLLEIGSGVDITIPRTARGYEPLCATYSQRCSDVLRQRIDAKQLRLSDLFANAPELMIREVGPEEIASYGLEGRLFFNINTAEDHARSLEYLHDCPF